MAKGKNREIYLVLHDIRSVHNAGAIFRTADAIGVSKIYLTGYTPAPKDRYGRERSDFAKSALGAEKTVPWESAKSAAAVLKKLTCEGFFIFALEQDKRAVDYKKARPRAKTALVLGNETRGVPKSILKICDEIIEIPMRGKLARNRLPDDVGKESLNVSVAGGIALFRIFDRNWKLSQKFRD